MCHILFILEKILQHWMNKVLFYTGDFYCTILLYKFNMEEIEQEIVH